MKPHMMEGLLRNTNGHSVIRWSLEIDLDVIYIPMHFLWDQTQKSHFRVLVTSVGNYKVPMTTTSSRRCTRSYCCVRVTFN